MIRLTKISIALQTLFADLVQTCTDAEFDRDFPETGSISKREVRGQVFFYYTAATGNDGAARKQVYIGPERDPETVKRVRRFSSLKSSFKDRRSAVTALLSIGLPRPPSVTGEVMEALWKAGFFRSRGVMIGNETFQACVGLLGAKLTGVYAAPTDTDFVQFHSTSQLLNESIPSILKVLHSIDKSFVSTSTFSKKDPSAKFKNAAGYQVEFINPNRGSDDNNGEIFKMSSPLRYLDFLLHQPIYSVLLFKGGIPVTVPAPDRYAIHQLIVSALRNTTPAGADRALNNITQASVLISALFLDYRTSDLGSAWLDAWGRGPSWQTNMWGGAKMLQSINFKAFHQLQTSVEEAAVNHRKDPTRYWPTSQGTRGK